LSDSLFSYQIPVVRVVYGQVKRREGRLGLVLGLVLSLEQYFRRISIFFVAEFTATLALRIQNQI